jgi:hypothetical protein
MVKRFWLNSSASLLILLFLATGCTKEKPATIPVLSSFSIYVVAGSYAKSKCSITSDGGAEITSRGVCWSIRPDPTVSDSKTTDSTGVGTFTSRLTGLTAGTTYHARCYATNSTGTSYTNEIIFSTKPTLPTLNTIPLSLITISSAVSGGNINYDGGSPITARGVCWGIVVNPVVSLLKTVDGQGVGSFTSNITGLTPATTYHVRAYATNSLGTGYGSDFVFSTKPVLPILTTSPASEINSSTATCGGNITSDSGNNITSRGVCWSTSPNPTAALSTKTSDGNGIGSFVSYITGLSGNTAYYARAYATNSAGTAYGNQITFTTTSALPTNGLVAYYPFYGNANDESMYANHGSVVGASLTTDRFGMANRAYYFDGIVNHIVIPGGLPVTNSFSISFWAYCENSSGYSNVICDGSSNASANDFLINFRGNSIGICADKNNLPLNYEDSSPPSLSGLNILNKWVHVVWVMEPSGSKIYLDGSLIATINEAGTNEGFHDNYSYIGARQVSGNPDHFFKGKLDDIFIYNRPLSDSEIYTLFTITNSK